jgi:hypothetical protein
MTRLAANVAAASVLLYAVLWLLSTQVDAVRAGSPFADDPWDAIASYAAIFLSFVAGATWIRSLRHRGPLLATATARRIRCGSGLAAAIVLVAAGADLQAIGSIGFAADAGSTVALLTTLVLVSAVTAGVAIVMTLKAAVIRTLLPTGSSLEPDTLDDALVLAAEVAAAVGCRRPMDCLAARLQRFFDRSSLSPRRHRIWFGVVIALATAVAFDAWHAVREGPWANAGVAVTFGTLVATGILAAYLGTVIPLRLIRPERG